MFPALDPILGPFFFWAFAGVAVLCSLGLLLARHPLSGAINLIGVMLSLSGLYALLNSPFLAVLQVLVYAGAIMMLVVFVIMVLNQAKDYVLPSFDWYSLVGLPLPVLLGLALVQVLGTQPQGTATHRAFEVSNTDLIDAPRGDSQSLQVRFRAHDHGAKTGYLWEFGDVSSANGKDVTHTYAKPGDYTVTLTMTKPPLLPQSATIHMTVIAPVRGEVATVAAAMFDTSRAGPGYYLLFEFIGVLLLAAVVGAVVLAKRSLVSAPPEPEPPAEGHH